MVFANVSGRMDECSVSHRAHDKKTGQHDHTDLHLAQETEWVKVNK